MIGRLLDYFLACSDLPMSAPVCRDFWTVAMVCAFAIGGLAMIFVLWRYLAFLAKWDAALKADAARRAVNVEEIKRVRWQGDEAPKLNREGSVDFG